MSLLTLQAYLNAVPGSATIPVLRLKEGDTGVRLELHINGLNLTEKFCAIRGLRPDGQALFMTSRVMSYSGRNRAAFTSIQDLTAVPGAYRCNLTIFDTGQPVSADDDETQRLTVLPFMVVIEPCLRSDDNA